MKKIWLPIAVFFLVLGSGLYYIVVKKPLSVQAIHIDFQGNDSQRILFNLIKARVEPIAADVMGMQMWQLSLPTLEKQIKLDKRISEVEISRRLPNQLDLKITPHLPVAVFLKDAHLILPIAKDASLLPAMATFKSFDLPVMRGKELFESQDLRAQAIEILDNLKSTSEFSSKNISEITYDKKLGFTLTLAHQGEKIILGESDLLAKSKRIEKVLSYLQREGIRGRVIDGRFSKKVVVRPRNAL